MSPCLAARNKLHLRFVFCLSLMGIMLLFPKADADDLYWICESGDWGNPGCWNDPSFNGTPSFFLTSTDDVDRVTTYTGIGLIPGNARQILIDSTGSGTISLVQLGGVLEASQSIRIGVEGTGIFTHYDGEHSAFNVLLGLEQGSAGYYQLIDGTLESANEVIGSFGTGTFVQTGGVNANTGTLTLGHAAESHGDYFLLGSGQLSARDETIGSKGGGRFLQGGGSNVTGTLSVGVNSTGVYLLNSGTLSTTATRLGSDILTSSSGSGYFIQNGGTHTVTNTLSIGSRRDSEARYTLTSGVLNTNNVNLGGAGSGIFVQTGGQHIVGEDLYLAGSFNGVGVYTLAGGALTVDGLIGGGYGDRTLNLDGGKLNARNIRIGRLILGSTAGSKGSHTLKEGDSIYATEEVIGAQGTGTLHHQGGTNETDNLTINASSTYNLKGGRLLASNLDASNPNADFNFTGGVLEVDTFVGNLLNQGGTLAPRRSPVATLISGDYEQLAAATLQIEIGGHFLGDEFEWLNVHDTAALGGTLEILLYDYGWNAFSPALGDSFDILSAETIVGDFDFLTLAALGNGLGWRLDYLIDEIGSLDVARLSVISTVPVPAAIWLFSAALIGLATLGKRRMSVICFLTGHRD